MPLEELLLLLLLLPQATRHSATTGADIVTTQNLLNRITRTPGRIHFEANDATLPPTRRRSAMNCPAAPEASSRRFAAAAAAGFGLVLGLGRSSRRAGPPRRQPRHAMLSR